LIHILAMHDAALGRKYRIRDSDAGIMSMELLWTDSNSSSSVQLSNLHFALNFCAAADRIRVQLMTAYVTMTPQRYQGTVSS
jgi:hypothetical protein